MSGQTGPPPRVKPTGQSAPRIVSLPSLPGVPCPCGLARRAFADQANFPGTVHLTQISHNAATHYHRHQTEIYVILECEADGAIELDGELRSVKPLDAILIPPGVRHRAVGAMRVLIICSPAFDPADEFLDQSESSGTNNPRPS